MVLGQVVATSLGVEGLHPGLHRCSPSGANESGRSHAIHAGPRPKGSIFRVRFSNRNRHKEQQEQQEEQEQEVGEEEEEEEKEE